MGRRFAHPFIDNEIFRSVKMLVNVEELRVLNENGIFSHYKKAVSISPTAIFLRAL